MSFLELDCSEIALQLQQVAAEQEQFLSDGDKRCADCGMELLGKLAARHVYFQLPYLQWFTQYNEGTVSSGPVTELRRLAQQLPAYQQQTQAFLERALDIDQVGREVQRNVRRLYSSGQMEPELFHFETIPVDFGPVDGDTCGLILRPSTVRELIDFSLRDCVTRGIPLRRCRNCGRYFPLTGRVTAEYCSRPNPGKKPCRNTAAVQKWEESRREDLVFKEYRREYKRRFAWIRAGKLSEEEFAEWSRQARSKKAECEEGGISLEEFVGWLRTGD